MTKASNKKITAQLFSIGNELLIGQVLDTNSSFIAKELDKIGVEVIKISAIPDSEEAIIQSITNAEKESEIIIMTGGLGPTKDDITKYTLAKLLEVKLIKNEEVYAHIEHLFELKGLILNDYTKTQANLPSSTIPLENKIGTAPGMWTRFKSSVVINLPGVPKEMKLLVKEQVIPKIFKEFERPYILHETVLSVGVPESVLAEKLEDWEENLPKGFSFAYLPNSSRVRLRISGFSSDFNWLKEMISIKKQELIELIKDSYEFYSDEPIESQLFNLLQNKNLTISVAESCTGGAISSKIVSQPGASKYYIGGVVAYSNYIKINQLQVKESTLKEFGAVSQETVSEMAENISKLYKTDIGIATSGIAPTSENIFDNKNNHVYLAIYFNNETIISHHKFHFLDRPQFITTITEIALKELVKIISNL
ncbi:MAG: CinA family nicotinamide mononucleotide deamidase-related protein [Solirubrobacteraceae bacterium]